MKKNIAVLGSTGSIGTQALDVIRKFSSRFNVLGLAAGSYSRLFQQQIEEFQPRYAWPPGSTRDPGPEWLPMAEIAAQQGVDLVVIATPGSTAINSVMAAAGAGKVIALSNKESLVSLGEILLSEQARCRAEIRPVDSEHSAIWQCLAGEKSPPARIILTASGGPFRDYAWAELANVTPGQALRHPSWKMGRKVTVDSATLMNKGLEVIEAHYLFDMPYDRIDVLVHPQSIVHSLVEFGDGVVKAQLGQPDMRLPIQFALSYPERWDNAELPRLDLIKTGHLDFVTPEHSRFPCLKLALEAGIKGGTYPAVLCAADEATVELFLQGRIKFTDIANIIDKVLTAHKAVTHPKVEDINAAGSWAKAAVQEIVEKERVIC